MSGATLLLVGVARPQKQKGPAPYVEFTKVIPPITCQ